jgi:c-di-GMP-binding flagellar brake protein YcgR
MNEKLNFLTHTLGDNAIKYVIPTVPVNISAGGLSFDTAQRIEHGSVVDLLLVLNKQDGPIMLRSQVVKIIPHPDGTQMIALEFQHMGEEARRQLVYFIQTKEIELAREKRGN